MKNIRIFSKSDFKPLGVMRWEWCEATYHNPVNRVNSNRVDANKDGVWWLNAWMVQLVWNVRKAWTEIKYRN